MTRLHKYTFTVTLWTTDGVSSPDAMMEIFVKDAAAHAAGEYQYLDVELHDRATCPTSFDVLADKPRWPSEKRDESAYWTKRDEWIDKVCETRLANSRA